MALTKNFITNIGANLECLYPNLQSSISKGGDVIKNSYIRIDNINGTKQDINLGVNIYSDKECKFLIESRHYTFVPSTGDNSFNFVKQGYEYLKTLDEFKDAVDC